MNKKLSLILCSLAFFSCNSSQYKFWDISKFDVKPEALKDNAKIKLLYTSQKPVSEEECYIHLIVVSQERGDTFNILTAADNGFKKEDSSKVFVYFNENNLVTKIDQLTGDEENLTGVNIDSINMVKVRRYNRVARDPKFDYLADNKYPTVIGSIGIRTIPAIPE